MDYETMEWEAEAKRVVSAFQIMQPCAFIAVDEFGVGFALRSRVPFEIFPLSVHQTTIGVFYEPQMRRFVLEDWTLGDGMPQGEVELAIGWDGQIHDSYVENSNLGRTISVDFAEALYHLSLLSPEVEAELKVTITAHQKLEWALEYEKRMKTL